jgi:hypothetical protein
LNTEADDADEDSHVSAAQLLLQHRKFLGDVSDEDDDY